MMISNLTIRSNLIEGLTRPSEVEARDERMNAPLARISARDLNELCELNPCWVRYFDKRHLESGIDGLPTPEQRAQWTAYLFYGDKSVSMQDGTRCSKPWEEMAEILLSKWDELARELDEELAMECLCIIEMTRFSAANNADSAAEKWLGRLDAISDEISQFLQMRGIHQSEQMDRVRRILSMSD